MLFLASHQDARASSHSFCSELFCWYAWWAWPADIWFLVSAKKHNLKPGQHLRNNLLHNSWKSIKIWPAPFSHSLFLQYLSIDILGLYTDTEKHIANSCHILICAIKLPVSNPRWENQSESVWWHSSPVTEGLMWFTLSWATYQCRVSQTLP